ncbi:MAG TPA: hypothetical protein VEY51_17130, partial [Chondromyces sp.]|nr:hypothetical protein [Chondromyces sp.]
MESLIIAIIIAIISSLMNKNKKKEPKKAVPKQNKPIQTAPVKREPIREMKQPPVATTMQTHYQEARQKAAESRMHMKEREKRMHSQEPAKKHKKMPENEGLPLSFDGE